MSFTYTTEYTFTRTSARYIASKVVADLRRLYSYYGSPSEQWIIAYFEELTELLAARYVVTVEYGFKRGDERVVSLWYSFSETGAMTDDRAGGVYSRANVSDAEWFSFLTYSSRYFQLTPAQKEAFEQSLPFRRTSGSAPRDGEGYWTYDRSYSADGVVAARRVFRPLQ